MASNTCPDHSNQCVENFCMDCRVISCNLCVKEANHKEHKFTDIKTAAEELSKKADKNASKWLGVKKDTQEFMSLIDWTKTKHNDLIHNIREDIVAKYKDMKSQMENDFKELIQEVNEIDEDRKKELQAILKEGEEENLMIESYEKGLNEMKSAASDVEVIQSAVELLKKGDEILAHHCRLMRNDKIERNRSFAHKLEFYPREIDELDEELNMLGTTDESFTDVKRCPNWSKLLWKDCDVQEIPPGRDMVIYKDELYMIIPGKSYLQVHSLLHPYPTTKKISVPGMMSATALVYNEKDFCMYVGDYGNPGYIHKINTLDKFSVTGWVLQKDRPSGLSISAHKHLLVTYHSRRQLDLFNVSGQLIDTIELNDGITGISHAIELQFGGVFLVCVHSPEPRVLDTSTVSPTGNGYRSYPLNVESAQLTKSPYRLGLDQIGNVLVSSCDGHPLKVLTAQLQYIGGVSFDSSVGKEPYSFCWDKANERLFVTSENKGFVITP